MTRTQIRELKTILLIVASRLPSEALDDSIRLLLYKAQTLADEALQNRPVRQALSKAG